MQLISPLWILSTSPWEQARLPIVHAKELLDVLTLFAEYPKTVANIVEQISTTEMWHETNSQKDGTIVRNVHFAESPMDLIYSGPHIGVANPLFQTSQRNCSTHRAFDNVDLTQISEDYIQRCNYTPGCSWEEYAKRAPKTSWNASNIDGYRIIIRKNYRVCCSVRPLRSRAGLRNCMEVL